ncbi:kinesin-like protein KIN-12F isoform X2 [Nymphaea colorata]|uniref:kinesin-like protein KIN-12F isoform X2 n=1 Tax=Nymphaea colorata TaxID=210225 RepID=UPI00129EB413|nr:kinesin-like protein KIN-12F isoform X2 [Nymphaea colorata]
MLRDMSSLRFFRRNAGKGIQSEESENVPVNPADAVEPSMEKEPDRPPLSTIQNPGSIPEQELCKKRKLERTPSRNRGIPPRTPDKPGIARNRFGWGQRMDQDWEEGREDSKGESCSVTGTNSLPPAPRGPGSGYTTPRANRTAGKASSANSESSLAQSTPTKSVSKPRSVNFGTLSRGASAVYGPVLVVDSVAVPHFELREDPSFWMDHNVQVLVRIRPLNNTEKNSYGHSRCLRQESAQSITWIGQPETRFIFDHVACETITQEVLFRVAGLPMVENCMSGYNSCIFAYGQTGSGKTYTMLGQIDDIDKKPSPDQGMMSRIFEFLFARIRAEEESRMDEKVRFSCKCSFLEIYNEQITDLLDPSSTNLMLREDTKKGVYVENLTEYEVNSVSDVLKLLIQGSSNRKVAATNMNRESSRSHSVFTCVIESCWEKNSTTNFRYGRLNLVDLAGSERQKSSGAEGDRLKEAANINKSLSTLGHVIMVLVDVAHGKQRHIPYRDSRLTFLLQDSLGGNSKTMIIANVSPSLCCSSETLSTLKFAQRAKLIQNNAVVNEDTSGDVTALQNQIHILKEEIALLKRQNVSRSLSFNPDVHNDDACKNNNFDDVNGLAISGSPRISCKKLKSLEATLVGSLRREQMQESMTKQLEAEIEQLNRLVRQREEDTRGMKMMLRFREDKIQRMKSLVDSLMPSDVYLLQEKNALTEELELLRNRVDRNPEVTRFAMENIRLLEQLKKFQEFYQEGEREILLGEVSALRNQLIQLYDGKFKLDNIQNIGCTPQMATKVGAADVPSEDKPLRLKMINCQKELERCRNNLSSCMADNEKLTREIDDLHIQLDAAKSLCRDQEEMLRKQHVVPLSPIAAAKTTHTQADVINKHNQDLFTEDILHSTDDQKSWGKLVDGTPRRGGLEDDIVLKYSTDVINLQLELDLVRVMLEEERSCRLEAEKQLSDLCNEFEKENNQYLMTNEKLRDAEKELNDTRSIIEELESQNVLLLKDLESLKVQNDQLVYHLEKKEDEISCSKGQFENYKRNTQTSISHWYSEEQSLEESLKNAGNDESHFQLKLKRMQHSLEKARKLNLIYQSDQASQSTYEQEMDKVREQVEAETAQAIICLQEELAMVQQQANMITEKDLETGKRVKHLEDSSKGLQDKVSLLMKENSRLVEEVQKRDEEMKSLTEEWEKVACEIAKVLVDGNEVMENALYEVNSIAQSFPRRSWISIQVEKMISCILEKDAQIEDLKRCLMDAQAAGHDVEWKLQSLKDATVAVTEAQKQEINEKGNMILLLKSQLDEKASEIIDLESKVELAKMEGSEYFEIAIEEIEIQVESAWQWAFTSDAVMCVLLGAITNHPSDELLSERCLAVGATSVGHLDEETAMELGNDISILNSCLKNCLESIRDVCKGDGLRSTPNGNEKSLTIEKYVVTSVKPNQEIVARESLYDGYPKLDRMLQDHKYACQDDCGKRTLCRFNVDHAHDGHCTLCDCIHDHNELKRSTSLMLLSENERIDGKGITTVPILRKEIHSAVSHARELHVELSRLLAEKKMMKDFEEQSRVNLESLSAEVLKLQEHINQREKEFELTLLEMCHRLNTVMVAFQEVKYSCVQHNKAMAQELETAKATAVEKTVEASQLVKNFEEAQATMREAEFMVNELVKASESSKLKMEKAKKVEAKLISQQDFLLGEIQRLNSSANLMNQEFNNLEEDFLLSLTETRSLVIALQDHFRVIQLSVMEDLKSIACDIYHLKSLVLESACLAKKGLEDVWTDIIGKDCAVSVLHLCHMGIFLEAVTGLNAEIGFLDHGLSESNTVIASLRENNLRAKGELEACSHLRGKLLTDIKSSFDRIIKKEKETGQFREKLNDFEGKILDLQAQEELLLTRSNNMFSELGFLMKEIDENSKSSLMAVLNQENLLREQEQFRHKLEEFSKMEKGMRIQQGLLKESILRHLHLFVDPSIFIHRSSCIEQNEGIEHIQELMEQHAEYLLMTLSCMDFELLVFSSELTQKSVANLSLCIELDQLRAEKELMIAQLEKYAVKVSEFEKELEIASRLADTEDNLLCKIFSGSTAPETEDTSVDLGDTVRFLQHVESEFLNGLTKRTLRTIELGKERNNLSAVLQRLKEEIVLLKVDQELENQFLVDMDLEMDLSICSHSIIADELDLKTEQMNLQMEKINALSKENGLLRRKVNEINDAKEKLSYELLNFKGQHALVTSDLERREEVLDLKNEQINTLMETIKELSKDNELLKNKTVEINDAKEKLSYELSNFKGQHALVTSNLERREEELAVLHQQRVATMQSLSTTEIEKKELTSALQRKDSVLFSTRSNANRCLDLTQQLDIDVSRTYQRVDKSLSFMLGEVTGERINSFLDDLSDGISECEMRVLKIMSEYEYLESLAEELYSENFMINFEITRKDEVLKGLSFDLSLLQETASKAKDQEDELREMKATLVALEGDLDTKSNQLDCAIQHSQVLEADIKEKIAQIASLELENATVFTSLQEVSNENCELKRQLDGLLSLKNSVDNELENKSMSIEELTKEAVELKSSLESVNISLTSLKSDLEKTTKDRNFLEGEVISLKEKVAVTQALAEENEAVAAEEREMAEARRAYAEDKEEEVKLLERSIEELECTINVLENKVEIVKDEAERQRMQSEELEIELQALRHQMSALHTDGMKTKMDVTTRESEDDLQRLLDGQTSELLEAKRQIEFLRKTVMEKDFEIEQCKSHISELTLHAEAQASEYKQKFKSLEAMVQQVKPEPACSQAVSGGNIRTEKAPAKARGSGSPFKCIGLGLAHQLNSEKDEELSVVRLRMEELEALAASRQKEIFMLNTRLAAAESMTHDVIRDLLGVKLDITNYASLLDQQKLQELTEKARHQSEQFQEKEKEVVKLRQQLNEFIEERRGWIDEINRRHAEMVAAQISCEKLRQKEQFLTIENDMLKMENTTQKKKVVELETEVKKLSGQQNLQQRIHHHAKIKEENNLLKVHNEELAVKVRSTETLLVRVNDELARYRACSGKKPYIDVDEEQILKNKLKEIDEERIQLAQRLLSMCTSILKAAGITCPVRDISPDAAEEALVQLKDRATYAEKELQDLKLKYKICKEQIRLSELRLQDSPSEVRKMEGLATPRKLPRSPSVTAA